MSLEAAISENTSALRELIAALTAAGAIQTAQAPGVDKVVKAQKNINATEVQTKAVEDAAKKSDTPATTSGEQSTPAPATESDAAVDLKPWHEKTAALFAELKDKEPLLANVQKAVLGINANIGREQATGLLQRFGAAAITPKPDKKGLDESQYPEVFALALQVLAGRVDVTESMVSE